MAPFLLALGAREFVVAARRTRHQ